MKMGMGLRPLHSYLLRRPAAPLVAAAPALVGAAARGFSATPAAGAAAQRVPVQPGVVSERRGVPASLAKPSYWESGDPAPQAPYISVHDEEGVRRLAAAGRLARNMLDYACSLAKEGVSTDDIDAAVHDKIVEAGAYPTPLNYMRFPKSVCSSVNEVACHGIPDDRALRRGDIVSFDVSLYLDGYHGDNCATVIVGETEADAPLRKLSDATEEALGAAIETVRAGSCLSDIGAAIQDVADANGYTVVTHFCGHGIGTELHEAPLVFHARNAHRLELVPNMVFTIEPILAEGTGDVKVWSDGWTAVTLDGSYTAQFEHMVRVTPTGSEILTLPE